MREGHSTQGFANQLASARRGISLLEVLAAIGVLSIGLLGLAALLPVGRYTLSEAAKADRAGSCGRAALRDIIVRRMLDPNNWTSDPGKSISFLIDPEGVANNMGPTFANAAGNGSATTTVPRIGVKTAAGAPINAAAVQSTDDLIVTLPEDMNPPQAVGRPLNITTNGTPQPLAASGDYSWFATVTRLPNNPTLYNVSIVVCYKRNLTPSGERAVPVSQFFDTANLNGAQVALGGGSVQLARPVNDTPADASSNPPSVAGIQLKENDWVALVSTSGNTKGLCRWYRVAALGDPDPTDKTQYLTLIGPDWVNPAPGSDLLVALGQSVLGVYTTTIALDTDPLWKN
jgi:type II secretory pathway pseudopilin PulG